MTQEELYNSIEQYLAGKSSGAERAEIERRIETDAGFRAEVNIHRDLLHEFADAENLNFRLALDRFMASPPPLEDVPPDSPGPENKPSGANWRLIGGIATIAVLAGIFFLGPFFKPETAPPLSPAPENTAPVAPLPIPAPPSPTPTPPVEAKKPMPIAFADPKDFLPNPILEARITDQVRGDMGGETKIELSSPTAGSVFLLKKSTATIPFRGFVTSGPIPGDRPLQLFIYSNRPEPWDKKEPLFSIPILTKPTVDESIFDINFHQSLSLTPGLYYLVVGQKREEDEGFKNLWFGKVVVNLH